MSKKKKTNSRPKISPELFKRNWGDTEEVIVRRVFARLKKLSNDNDRNSIYMLASHPSLPASLVPMYKKEEDIYKVYGVGKSITPPNYIYWLLGLLHREIDTIKHFNEARKIFNSALMKSDEEGLNAVLTKINQHSFSWWSLENRMHVKKELTRASTKDELQALEGKFNNADAVKRLKSILLLSESSSVGVYAEIISSQLKEYRSSGQQDAIDYGAGFSCMRLPIFLDPDREANASMLFYFRTEPIIDQYVLLKSMLMDLHAKNIPLEKEALNHILRIASQADDEEILNLFSGHCPIDDSVREILRDYTRGDYDSVIGSIGLLIEQGSAGYDGLIDVYARARARLRVEGREGRESLYDFLANNLSKIITLSPGCKESISYLKKISVKFRNEPWAKSLIFHLLATLKLNGDSSLIELSRLQTKCLGSKNTPKAYTQNYAPELTQVISLSQIPQERAIKYGLLANAPSGKMAREEFTIISDYIQIQITAYLKSERWLEAMDFAIDEYFRNKLSYLFLPLDLLCKHAISIDKADEHTYISALIILDIYSREIGGAYEEFKCEVFEEFWESKATHRPSDIYGGRSDLTLKEEYFLKNICIPAQLDNISDYRNNDEVVHERIRILDTLISSGCTDFEILEEEKDSVIEALFSSKLRAKIESGKLFVDVQALEARRKFSYKNLFEQAKSIDGGIILEPLGDEFRYQSSSNILQIGREGEELSVAVASNEKTDTLHKIYMHAVKDFALNEDYGLDKYLSAEIRHVVLVSQLRACFEKYRLVTVAEGGSYITNTYWRDTYSYVNRGYLDRIDVVLAEFSKNIDEILSETNNLFRVTTEFDERGYVFDFSAYYSRLVGLSRIVDRCEGFDDFFKSVFEYMWEICAEHARRAQNIINESLKTKVLEQISTLESAINIIKGDAAMADLMEAIRGSRFEFLKELETVLNWFRSAGVDDGLNSEKLGIVIEASLSAFQSLYGHKNLNIIYNGEASNLALSYRESRALLISIFTALDNAVAYKTPDSAVQMSHFVGENHDTIEISNYFEKESTQGKEKLVEELKGKWNALNSNLSREEGGSGIYKIYNLLLNASAGFEFDINARNDKFIARIRMAHENFAY